MYVAYTENNNVFVLYVHVDICVIMTCFAFLVIDILLIYYTCVARPDRSVVMQLAT